MFDLGFSALGRAVGLPAEAAPAAAAAGIGLPPARCGSRLASPPTPDLLKLTLTVIFYIYECHREDLHLLSRFV